MAAIQLPAATPTPRAGSWYCQRTTAKGRARAVIGRCSHSRCHRRRPRRNHFSQPRARAMAHGRLYPRCQPVWPSISAYCSTSCRAIHRQRRSRQARVASRSQALNRALSQGLNQALNQSRGKGSLRHRRRRRAFSCAHLLRHRYRRRGDTDIRRRCRCRHRHRCRQSRQRHLLPRRRHRQCRQPTRQPTRQPPRRCCHPCRGCLKAFRLLANFGVPAPSTSSLRFPAR